MTKTAITVERNKFVILQLSVCWCQGKTFKEKGDCNRFKNRTRISTLDTTFFCVLAHIGASN